MSGPALTVFDIQRFAIHDGPGIRTTVFLKGCPLFCPWCANPESQSVAPELLYDGKKCIGCGGCTIVCPHEAAAMEGGRPRFNRNRCKTCGACVEACPADSLRVAGKEMTISDIMEVLRRDENYYLNSGGGITISGGEPLVQYPGVKALLEACREQGYHTAVETCGDIPPYHFTSLFDLVDLYLLDLKHPDAAILLEVTGGKLERILANLDAVATRNPDKIVLRTPVIPGFNDDEDTLEQVFRVAVDHVVERVHLLPYHTLGVDKYAGTGREYSLKQRPMLKKEDLLPAQEQGRRMGLQVYLGG